jgi:ribose 5-phosphate isomerase RpiB
MDLLLSKREAFMKRILVSLALLSTFLGSMGIAIQADFEIEEVKAEIAKHLEKPERGFIKITNEIESDTALSKLGNEFFNENFLYIDYLTKHDESYLESITQVFGLYLISKGEKTTGFSDNTQKDFSLHDLKATAVRFMFPTKVTKEGKIGVRICVTGEGFRDYSERNINFEAFTFDAIFNEIKKEDASFLMTRIQEYGKLARELKLSTSENDLLIRAQGALWALFYNDKDFEKMLIECYQKKSEYMPFKIVLE